MMKPTLTSSLNGLSRRQLLKAGGAAVLTTPFASRAWAATTEINMLAWYGHGEADMSSRSMKRRTTSSSCRKYYAGGDNMLALIAQSPAGTYDLILSDGGICAAAERMRATLKRWTRRPITRWTTCCTKTSRSFPGHWADGKLYSMMLRGGHLGVSYNKNSVTAEEAAKLCLLLEARACRARLATSTGTLPNAGHDEPLQRQRRQAFGIWTTPNGSAVQETTMGLRKQVGGFFDYGGTFNGLKNGEMQAMVRHRRLDHRRLWKRTARLSPPYHPERGRHSVH